MDGNVESTVGDYATVEVSAQVASKGRIFTDEKGNVIYPVTSNGNNNSNNSNNSNGKISQKLQMIVPEQEGIEKDHDAVSCRIRLAAIPSNRLGVPNWYGLSVRVRGVVYIVIVISLLLLATVETMMDMALQFHIHASLHTALLAVCTLPFLFLSSSIILSELVIFMWDAADSDIFPIFRARLLWAVITFFAFLSSPSETVKELLGIAHLSKKDEAEKSKRYSLSSTLGKAMTSHAFSKATVATYDADTAQLVGAMCPATPPTFAALLIDLIFILIFELTPFISMVVSTGVAAGRSFIGQYLLNAIYVIFSFTIIFLILGISRSGVIKVFRSLYLPFVQLYNIRSILAKEKQDISKATAAARQSIKRRTVDLSQLATTTTTTSTTIGNNNSNNVGDIEMAALPNNLQNDKGKSTAIDGRATTAPKLRHHILVTDMKFIAQESTLNDWLANASENYGETGIWTGIARKHLDDSKFNHNFGNVQKKNASNSIPSSSSTDIAGVTGSDSNDTLLATSKSANDILKSTKSDFTELVTEVTSADLKTEWMWDPTSETFLQGVFTVRNISASGTTVTVLGSAIQRFFHYGLHEGVEDFKKSHPAIYRLAKILHPVKIAIENSIFARLWRDFSAFSHKNQRSPIELLIWLILFFYLFVLLVASFLQDTVVGIMQLITTVIFLYLLVAATNLDRSVTLSLLAFLALFFTLGTISYVSISVIEQGSSCAIFSQQSIDTIISKSTGINSQPYQVCGTTWAGGLDIVDLTMFARLAYYKPNDAQLYLDVNFNNFAYTYFNTTYNGPYQSYWDSYVNDWEIVYHTPSTTILHYYQIHSASRNTTVIAIRGTDNSPDVLLDMKLWFGSALYQTISVIFPVVMPSEFQAIFTDFQSKADPSIFGEINHFFRNLTETYSHEKIIVTGHSLGGGVAAAMGSKWNVAAVSISGPGLLFDPKSFGVQRADVQRVVTEIVPKNDLVPQIGLLGGMVQNIDCYANDLACHQIGRSATQLYTVCNLPPYTTNARRRNLTIAEITCPQHVSYLDHIKIN